MSQKPRYYRVRASSKSVKVFGTRLAYNRNHAKELFKAELAQDGRHDVSKFTFAATRVDPNSILAKADD